MREMALQEMERAARHIYRERGDGVLAVERLRARDWVWILHSSRLRRLSKTETRPTPISGGRELNVP